MEKYIVKLTHDERENLLCMLRKGKASVNKLMHARVLLESDEADSTAKKKTDEEISKQLYVSEKTVARIRKRFVEEGLEAALLRKPHANPKSRKINGDQEAHLIALCCSKPPEGRSRWTLKLLANRLVEMEIVDSVSPVTVSRVLKKRIEAIAKTRMVYSTRSKC
jgi:transposase